MKKIGILGAGSWGTALSVAANEAGLNLTIYSRDERVANSINQNNENTKYLPDIKLSKSIVATSSLSDLINCEAVLIVVPAQTLRQVCYLLKDLQFPGDIPLILCSKGVEVDSYKSMSEVVSEILPDNTILTLSGPNFAREVAMGLPAGATIACNDKVIGMQICNALSSNVFRPYYSADIIGCEIAGAVKNVLAIACGICMGRNLGENARATLITRGVAEISRLCIAKGGKAETLMGLSGIGDIMLTCGSTTSRNMSLGLELGQGHKLDDILQKRKTITEGFASAKSVMGLADKLNVDMPICRAVYDVLYNNTKINDTIDALLNRPIACED